MRQYIVEIDGHIIPFRTTNEAIIFIDETVENLKTQGYQVEGNYNYIVASNNKEFIYIQMYIN